MSQEPDCIFCKIAAGEIPCFKLHEDESTIAFMDINPVNPGQALIIHKAHHQDLFSIPALGQTETLSYLLTGRPLESANSSEGSMMASAALALGLSGGDRIARSMGDRFGFDEMRIESGGEGDQASLVVGRYLSPRLYVGYGVGLVESINTLNLNYRITDRWQLEAESGANQGADLYYRFER